MSNKPVVLVDVRQVYGTESIYPVNDTARQFAALAGTKTLTRAAVRIIREMGYEVHVSTVRAVAHAAQLNADDAAKVAHAQQLMRDAFDGT